MCGGSVAADGEEGGKVGQNVSRIKEMEKDVGHLAMQYIDMHRVCVGSHVSNMCATSHNDNKISI